MDDLLAKLEEKAIRIALIDYKIQDFRAAQWSIKSVLEQYPASFRKLELKYDLLYCYYHTANNSIENKKLDRENDLVDYYNDNKDLFKGSKYAAQGQNIYNRTISYINKHNKTINNSTNDKKN